MARNPHQRRENLEYLNTIREKITQNIWSAIPIFPEVKKASPRAVFYFMGDVANSSIIHDVVYYGFSLHMDMLYNFNDYTGMEQPIAVTEWKDIVSAVTDGQIMITFGYGKKSILPINQIYAFKLEGKDHLTNITDSVRAELSIIKK